NECNYAVLVPLAILTGEMGESSMRRNYLRTCALATVVAVMAVACGDNKSSTGGTATTSGAGTTAAGPATTTAPVKGGTLTVGTYSEAPGVDPILTSGAGTTYGMEAE